MYWGECVCPSVQALLTICVWLYTGVYVTVCAWLVIYAYCAYITVCLCSCLYFTWCVWVVVCAVKSKSRHKYVLFLQREISRKMAYNQRKRKFISFLFYLMFAQIGVPLIWEIIFVYFFFPFNLFFFYLFTIHKHCNR